jgi:hypothetical protein
MTKPLAMKQQEWLRHYLSDAYLSDAYLNAAEKGNDVAMASVGGEKLRNTEINAVVIEAFIEAACQATPDIHPAPTVHTSDGRSEANRT